MIEKNMITSVSQMAGTAVDRCRYFSYIACAWLRSGVLLKKSDGDRGDKIFDHPSTRTGLDPFKRTGTYV